VSTVKQQNVQHPRKNEVYVMHNVIEYKVILQVQHE